MDYTTVGAILSSLIGLFVVAPLVSHKLSWKFYDFNGKHVLVTGGSKGLGQATVIDVVKRGASVSIIARGEKQLEETKKLAEAAKKSSQQKIETYSCDVSDKTAVAKVMVEVEKKIGVPDCLINCAGFAIPKLFIDATPEDFEKQVQVNYLGSVFFAKEVADRMIKKGVQGRIVFITSTMSLVSFVGYGPYSPTKWALRSLCDTLRNELGAYGIKVQIAYPPNMETEGYANENKVKPEITKKIDGLGDLMKPSDVSKVLVKGIENGGQHISFDFMTELLRVYAGGVSERSNFFLEVLVLPLLALVFGLINKVLDLYLHSQGKKKKD